MVPLTEWKDVLELGLHLLRELKLDQRDTIDRWMVFYLAELIDASENGKTEDERKEARKIAGETILKIWERRLSLPRNAYPLARYKDILKILDRLQSDHFPFMPLVKQAEVKKEELIGSIYNELLYLFITVLLMRLPPGYEPEKADSVAVCHCRCKTPHLCRIKIPQFVDGGRSLQLAECHTTEDPVRLFSTDGGDRSDYLGETVYASRTACTRRVHQRHCPPDGPGPEDHPTSPGRGDRTAGVRTESAARLTAGPLQRLFASPACRVSGVIRLTAVAGDYGAGVSGRLHHPDRLPAYPPAAAGSRL